MDHDYDLIVIGGGAAGLAAAQAGADAKARTLLISEGKIGGECTFARLGSQVTVIEAAPWLLSAADPPASKVIGQVLADEGVMVRAGTSVEKIEISPNGPASSSICPVLPRAGTTDPGFPSGRKGFVGGTADTATGLTDLGAREYQPNSGSFISPDSLLNPDDPQDPNAYTYAADNPTTLSDPTGAAPTPTPTGGDNCGRVRTPQEQACVRQELSQQYTIGTGPDDCTAPGTGQYYTNDTPLFGPPQNDSHEHQPWRSCPYPSSCYFKTEPCGP